MALTNKLTAIADAIRAKTGKTEELTLDQMVTEIEGISGGGGSEMEEQFRLFLEDDPNNPATKLPTGLTKIKQYAFYRSTIPSISIPDGVQSLGERAFYYCTNLSNISLPDGLTDIGTYAFQNCTSLTSVSLPAGLATISDGMFHTCSNLSSVYIPAGVKYVGNNSFAKCTGLTEITFNGTASSINKYAFNGANVKTINVPWAEGEVANAPWGATNATINYNYTGG